MIQNHPHRTGARLRGKLVRRFACQRSTLAKVGASDNPGAVQTAVTPDACVGCAFIAHHSAGLPRAKVRMNAHPTCCQMRPPYRHDDPYACAAQSVGTLWRPAGGDLKNSARVGCVVPAKAVDKIEHRAAWMQAVLERMARTGSGAQQVLDDLRGT